MKRKLGILGAGQLGRMLALAGTPLARHFSFLDFTGTPTAGLGDVLSAQNKNDIETFAQQNDVITYEFENIPYHVIEQLESMPEACLRPSAKSIAVCQHRAKEKALFKALGIPSAKSYIATSATELADAASAVGFPCIAKSCTDGYDGKGQAKLGQAEHAQIAWEHIQHPEIIVEQWIEFKRELSIIGVRSESGAFTAYPIAENQHHEGILRYSTAPAQSLNAEIQACAEGYIKAIAEELDHVGVITLELFETEQGLIANEIAPRVHNSGHWSIEASLCSQFENHIRAVADLPLGSTETARPTCMINILSQTPRIDDVLKLPYAHLHLYDKTDKPGRKLGHITVVADTYDELWWRVSNIQSVMGIEPEYLPLSRSGTAQPH